jgi:soluble lytic murein transglycosylase-like protein
MRQHSFRQLGQLPLQRYASLCFILVVLCLFDRNAVLAGPMESSEQDYYLQRIRIQTIRENRSTWRKWTNHGKASNEYQNNDLISSCAIRTSKKNKRVAVYGLNQMCRRGYDQIVYKAAEKYGLPPTLIKAVIRAESGFDQYAVSHKGAQGLMQLMPETAKSLGVQNPFDPWENIFGGTRLLKDHLNEFGSLKKALIAYNAGPERVKKNKSIPLETKRYIKTVIRYYRKFQENR